MEQTASMFKPGNLVTIPQYGNREVHKITRAYHDESSYDWWVLFAHPVNPELDIELPFRNDELILYTEEQEV